MAESILKSCTSFPTSQTAVVQSTITPGILELSTRPVPVPLPGQVLIKVSCVALNNCDWKMPSRAPCPGAVNGADYSGTVVQLGEGVHSRFKIGDRVAGAQAGSNASNPSSGAFTEYVVGNPDQIWRVPETLSWEEAVAIGCAVITSVGMALYKSRQLSGMPEKPTLKAQYVLVYGGATASGTFAIQLLKLSGYKVVTTCSPKNFKLVKSYGAEKAFDYTSPVCGEDIPAYTKNSLAYVLDIITEAKTIRHCYSAIRRGGGRYCGFELLPEELIADMRKTVRAGWVLGLEMTGQEVKLPGGYYRKANSELAIWCYE